MKDRGIYKVGKPFYLRVEFVGDDINEETDSLIGRCLARGAELLPGLKLHEVFAQFADKDTILLNAVSNDLKELKSKTDELIFKYNCISEENIKKNIEKMKEEET